jgi:hypothetical protein
LVTVTTPVIVPAAPSDEPADALMWLHTAETAVGGLVVGAVVVGVVDDDVVVVRCVVVVVE